MNYLNGVSTGSDTPLKRILKASSTVDIPTTDVNSIYEFTISVPGAVPGDICEVTLTLLAVGTDATRSFNGVVTANDTVTVRLATGPFSANPGSTTYTATVWQF